MFVSLVCLGQSSARRALFVVADVICGLDRDLDGDHDSEYLPYDDGDSIQGNRAALITAMELGSVSPLFTGVVGV